MNRQGQSLCWLPLLIMVGVLVAACAQAATDLRNYAPNWVKWDCARISTDLDGDGEVELLTLDRGDVRIYENGVERYCSPITWAVSDAFCAEIDEEAGPEVMLITWKRGSFGSELPFWHERNDSNVSQHVFIFKYREDVLQPIWMSSELAGGARSASVDESGRLHLTDQQGLETVWQWEYFGLKLVENDADNPGEQSGQDIEAVDERYGVDAYGDTGDADASGGLASATLLAVGDNIVHDSLYAQMRTTDAAHFDFSPVYAQIAEVVQSADIAAVVQETPLIEDPIDYAGYPSFGTPQAVGEALAGAGFDVVCAATNHSLDRGVQGVLETIAFWKERFPSVVLLGMHSDEAEAQSVDLREANGITFALFDYTEHLNGAVLPADQPNLVDVIGNGERLANQVAEIEGKVDISVCFLHIGEEYASTPTAEQRVLVERIVDAGADVVVCSHPHVVQPMERISTARGNEAVVYWSLGNFASHQAELRTVLGGMARVSVHKNAEGETWVDAAELLPVVCHYTQETTSMYLLDDYTDDLARSHYLHTSGVEVSPRALWALWEKETS